MITRVVSKGLFVSALVGLAACVAPNDDDVGAEEAAITEEKPLSYVGEAVVAALAAKHPGEKGSTWNLSRDGALKGDFVKQFPPRATWGKSELSIAKRCAATEASCDPDFLLVRCESQAECGGGGTCTPLKSTIAHRGGAPKKLCVGHSEERLDDIWSTITEAKKTLDLSSLSPPDGRFEAAIRNGITFASESASPPRVRMVFGDYWMSGMSKQSLIDGLLASYTRDVAKDSKIDVSVTAYAFGQSSWDHAKILARDGEFALVGGANLWDAHYLERNPVHDLWIAVGGGPAADAQRFIDRMFQFVCTDHRKPILGIERDVVRNARRGGTGCPVTFKAAHPNGGAKGGGGSPIIAAGRTGFAANPSDDAILAMVGAAKTKIQLSQQDFGPINLTVVKLGSWPTNLIAALVEAMKRGVDVDITLSNTGAVPGTMSSIEALYNGYDNGWTPAQVAQEFVDAAGGTIGAHVLVCNKLRLMRLRSSAAETWPSGGTLANHAKVIMVDDRTFYVGSQNAYFANHAEFGYIVDDAAAAKTFIDSYLGNVEKFSRRTAISGSGVSCGF